MNTNGDVSMTGPVGLMNMDTDSQESDVSMGAREEPRPSAVAPPILPPVPGYTGLALCAPLTDERLSAYRVPAGTERCGTNCIVCSLLLLGWVSREDAEADTQRCILAVAGAAPHITWNEVVQAVQRWHPYYYGNRVAIGMQSSGEFGARPGTLLSVLTHVPSGYGCFFVYGGAASHVVVVRKLPDGTPELIDPQRGAAIMSRFTPSEEFRALHGINLQQNYYSVRGEEHILATIVEQSVLFGYFPSREEASARMEFRIVTYTTV